MSIIIKDVTFNNVPKKKSGTKIPAMLTQSNIQISLSVNDYLLSEDFYTLISALDIDWGNIQVEENVVIEDTADLINWIKSLKNEGGSGGGTVDSTFSKTSTNALLNKVITETIALKNYNSVNHTGLGIKLLIPNSTYTLVSSDFLENNTVYIIKYNFTVNGSFSLPKNCVLKFEGGSLSGGTITGNHTVIEASPTQIFDLSSNITLAGTWTITEVYPEWWGAKGDGVTNCTTAFQKAVNFAKTSGTVKIPMGEYLLNTVEFDGCQGLNFEGSGRECTILTMNTSFPVIKFVNHVSEKCNVGNFSIKPATSGTIDDTDNVGIYFTLARQCRLHDLSFIKNEWAQLYAFILVNGNFTYNNVIELLYITATDPDGLNRGGIKYCIKTTAIDAYHISAVLDIRNCTFYGIVNQEASIDMSACNRYKISSCNIESNGRYGIILGTLGVIENNWVESTKEASLLFLTTGTVVSSNNILICNSFNGPEGGVQQNVVNSEYCNGNILIGNFFGNSTIVKSGNTVNVEGLPVAQPTLTPRVKPEEITIDGETITYNAGVWHLEYNVSGLFEYPLVFNVTTTSTANIKRINAAAQDIWNDRYITGCSASGNRVMLDYKGDMTRLMVDVEFC